MAQRGERYVSIQPASPAAATLRAVPNEPSSAQVASTTDDALEFVRFCYRRRKVGWPALYDEMSIVASRGLFRGMGYSELAENGISFCLGDLPRLAALTERVMREEQPIAEPRPSEIRLSMVAARP